jgi:hypothetical protein
MRLAGAIGGDGVHGLKQRYLIAAASCLILPSAGSAQGENVTRSGFGFRPSRETNGYLLTEFAVRASLSNPDPHPGTWLYALDVGAMRNVGSRYGLGASAYVASTPDLGPEFHFGLRPRFRIWLDERSAVDLFVGIPIADNSYSRTPLLYLGTALMWRDIIGLDLGVDVVDSHYAHEPDVNWGAGVRMGQEVGAGSGILGGAILGVIFLIFASSGMT